MQEKTPIITPKPGGQMTPMMEQFVEIKAANPGSLLFYRMGDFYELFFEDAEIASRALGIALTKRGKHQGADIPMCGVPVRAADDYLMKLIKLGHRVSVCEQLEDPAQAKLRGSKSVVRRDVTRLVTPGTITEEKLLDPSRSNFLCALARIRSSNANQEFALAWIDLSTGTFITQNSSLQNLADDLSRIDPSELILSQSLYDQPEMREALTGLKMAQTPLPSNLFDSALAEKQVCEYFKTGSLDGLGNFSKCELTAAAAILAYVEKTQIAERPALSRLKSQSDDKVLIIDAATRANLELVRTLSGERQGSLLKSIDRTLTGPGARELATRLVAPLTNQINIQNRLDAVSYFYSNNEILNALRERLNATSDMARALSRLALNRGGPRDIKVILEGFGSAGLIKILLEASNSNPINIAKIIDTLDGVSNKLATKLNEALADELPILAREGGFVRAGHHDELDELRVLRDESRKIIVGLQATYAHDTSVKTLKIRHNNVLGYFIEVTAGNSENLLSDEKKATYIHRQTLANVMRFTTTELAEIESKIANAAGRAIEIELEIFEQLRAALIDDSENILKIAEALAILDVYGALAILAHEHNYCRPVISDSLELNISGGRHPVIEQVLKKQSSTPFISNDCDLSPIGHDDCGSIWLLTGPNMGGKSTFLRQNALIVLLAQMGSFVPATVAKIGIVDRLFSRVGASDDLARGRSTFMVEMVETAAILNQATKNSLVILDEIGRGTATFDGLSIAWAAIEHLHEANHCRTIFATHYHELVALAKPLKRLSNVTMKVKEWNNEVVFLHEVISGAADRSYGIQVAQLAGLPVAVIERAREVLNQLESSERENSSTKIIDDLPLFNVAAKPAEPLIDVDTPLVAALREISPDELTPREALDKLYQLRAIIVETS